MIAHIVASQLLLRQMGELREAMARDESTASTANNLGLET